MTSRRRLGKGGLAAVIALSLVVLLGAGAAIAVWAVSRQLDASIERIDDPFEGLTSRPTPAPSASASASPEEANLDPVNILVLGSDSRISAGDASQWAYGAQRTDALMLVHIPGDRSGAYTISFQRDSWVDIPGYGMDKINAAFSYGGPSLLIETIENLTGVYIDHFVVADFESFAELTDTLGGVDITVPTDTFIGQGQEKLTAGTHHLDGNQALAYARERYNLPNGDFDRMRRQQNWMRAIAKQAITRDTLTNPIRLYEFISTASGTVAVDEGFTLTEMRDLGWSLRNVREGDLGFLLAPTASTGRERNGTAWVSYLDEGLLAQMSAAMNEDRFSAFVAENSDRLQTLGSAVN